MDGGAGVLDDIWVILPISMDGGAGGGGVLDDIWVIPISMDGGAGVLDDIWVILPISMDGGAGVLDDIWVILPISMDGGAGVLDDIWVILPISMDGGAGVLDDNWMHLWQKDPHWMCKNMSRSSSPVFISLSFSGVEFLETILGSQKKLGSSFFYDELILSTRSVVVTI